MPRTFSHWTPQYIRDRISFYYYEKNHPHLPWLTPVANEILSTYLKETDAGLEFGSGRSTLWLASRVAKLTSVEHHEEWATNIKLKLGQKDINNVDYRFRAKDVPEDKANQAAYVKVIEEFEDGSLDFCLVDGVYRDYCTLQVINKIRPGGLIIIDNVNRYLPSNSQAPTSRSITDGPNGPIWEAVYEQIASWRYIWNSSGVSDTAFYFKPHQLM